MKIVVLQGSPVLKGSSHMLASEFIRGAKEAGHEVTELEITRMDIHPCIGCLHCGYEGPCAQRDDMLKVKDELLSSDMVVFATPLYYYGMSAQLKTVVDRFCFFNSSLHAKRLKSALIASAWNSDDWTFDALETHYRTLVRYCHFTNVGTILGRGCGTPSMTRHSRYMEEAYRLGRSL